jgi:hypothetical protein
MVVAQALAGLMYVGLALLIITGHIQPWHLYATAFVMAIVQTFHQPARAAMIADAVPPYHLTNAIGLASLVFNMARSTARPWRLPYRHARHGELLYRPGGVLSGSDHLDPATAPDPSAATSVRGRAAPTASFGQSIVEGWTFSWRNEVVRAGLLIMMCASLFIVPFTTLLPVFARDLLGVGVTDKEDSDGHGPGCAVQRRLLASLGISSRGAPHAGGVTMYGLSVVAFAASPSFRLSLALMTIVGLAHVSSYALVQTVIQTYSPSAFHGRTMAIFHMSSVVMTLGSMLAGTLAALVGARWAAAAMGAAGALIMVIIGMVLPHARRIR